MWYHGRPVKIGLSALIALVVISAGLAVLSHQKVIALGWPIFEGTPFVPSPEKEYVPDQIIVKFKTGTPVEVQRGLNESLGTTVIYTSPERGFTVLQIPEGKTVAKMIDIYSRQPIVEYAEPNYLGHILPEAK